MKKEPYPRVSIAMCTYNGECFLREQLDSLIEQDYANLDIIIVDDASTDGTAAILSEYARLHDHIELHFNKENVGLIKNFEKALSLCSGKFVALCDQDDVWFPNKISKLVEKIGDSALIYTPVRMVDEHLVPINQDFYRRRKIKPVSGKCGKSLVFDNCILGHTTLFPHELLELALPFPDNIPAHDRWLSIIAAEMGGIKFYDQVQSDYRMHENNTALTNQTAKKRNKNLFHRRTNRIRRIRKKHQKQQALLNALATSAVFSESDQRLFQEIAKSYASFYRIWFNRKLALLIKQQGDAFFAMHENKEKMLKKICRGYLPSILR